MHGSFDRLDAREAQDATSSSSITSSVTAEKITPAKTRRKRSSKPKRALGPMTEPARLRALDWLMHQVGARKAERPHSYTAIALTFMEHFNDSDGKAYPSLDTLATLTGISKSMAWKVINLHLADGNIRIVDQGKPGRGHSTTYAIVIEPLPDDVAEARRRVGLREDRRKRNSGKLATVSDLTDTETPSRYAS
jgi:hypothetical protein